MAISSASTRIFKAEDPVMETDLQLLAKVNEYQQEQFDEGEKGLQDEINNWSMLANVAKPQDKDYINAKLNKLVSGIKNLGGVNLADKNNVNALKSLGYNMYGDDNVMNAVTTTRKLTALQQDIYNKTNGKNAKDYDSVYGEYLTNQYSDWLNDGQQGTKFDGPTSLPQGSFDNYNKKVSDALNKLTPDINEAPQDAKDALNYYQVGDKFIKKERVEAAIDAVTSAQDRDLLSAHAWKSMAGLPDQNLLALQRNSYDSKIAQLQSNWNDLQKQKSLANDYQQKSLFTNQMAQTKAAIDAITKQKSGLPDLQPGQSLDKGFQKNLRDNLFNDAFKEQYANARAYEQKKVELKLNQGKATQLKLDQTAWMFGKNYDLKVQELNLKAQELGMKEENNMLKLYGMYGSNSSQLASKFGVLGPAQNAPLSIIPNQGDKDATVVSDEVIKQADANYIAKANDFYTHGYNYLMGKDANLYGNFVRKDADGNWVPKDDKSRDILNQGLQSAVDLYGNVANMSIKERNGLSLSDDDIALFQSSKDLSNAKLYKDQIASLTDQVFLKSGLAAPSQQNVSIRLNNGGVVNLTYQKLREMQDRDDPLLKTWKANATSANIQDLKNKELGDASRRIFKSFGDRFKKENLKQYREEKEKIEAKYDRGFLGNIGSALGLGGGNSVDAALSTVNNYYNRSEVKTAWQDLSKNFNVYGSTVSLPKLKNGKPVEQLANYLATTIRSQHPDIAGGVQNDDVDLLRIYPIYDINQKGDNKVKYIGEVRYQKGSGSDKEGKDTKGDRITTVDLTDQVMRDHNSREGGFFGNLFPNDDAQVVYGMLLNNEGKTPLNAKDGYSTALQTHSSGLLTHKYQIVAMKNSNSGVDAYRVNLLVPKGKDQNGVPQFQTMPVINFDAITPVSKTITTEFPSNFKFVQDYMDEWFSSSDNAREFYRRHGIPYVEQTQQ